MLAISRPAAGQVVGQLELHELESDVFENTRTVRVWLPPGYANEDPGRAYPVLYLNDGQNLFDAETSTFNPMEWRVDETATDLIQSRRLRPLIVVGIDHAGRRGRAREYLPYPDESLDPPEPNPQGNRYAAFLEREVIPMIESRYRVLSGRENRGLGGSSYGALVSLHVAHSRPELFSRLLLESPSFYVSDYRVLKEIDPKELKLDRVYLGVGTNELGREGCPEDHAVNREAVAGVRRAAALFDTAGLKESKELRVQIESCAAHNERYWAQRLDDALPFLFPMDVRR